MSIRLLAAVIVVAWGCVAAAPIHADAIDVRARVLPFDATADPERTRVGRLVARRGVAEVLRSRFGGLSSLRVAPDGIGFTTVSDEGWRVDGRMVYDPQGRLTGVEGVMLVPLLSRRGWPLPELGKHESDAESLVRDTDGTLVIGFEGDHRIVRYPPGGAAPSLVAPPPGLQRAPVNSGLETLVRLRDGRLLAITEGLKVEGGVRGWIGGGKDGWQPFVWATSGGFVPTDATQLPSGELLVLERRFPPVGARLRLLPATSIKPGEILDGTQIARLEGSLQLDNMEGIDARRGPAGETLIWLISDDNYSFLQRTLLLLFRLVE
ncbi:MAG: esterase-like activity of phytase family protein [Rhodospirillales bacterium]